MRASTTLIGLCLTVFVSAAYAHDDGHGYGEYRAGPRAQDYVINSRGNTNPVGALLAGSRLKSEALARERNAFLLEEERKKAARADWSR